MAAVTAHPFLSPDWIQAARGVHEEFKHRAEPPSESIRVNITVTAAPFADGVVLGHIDSTSGTLVPDEGHVDEPDVAVTLPYSLARELLVDPQPDTVMLAFMSGEIEVAGDVTLLMSMQDVEATPEQQALADEVVARLHAITEPT